MDEPQQRRVQEARRRLADFLADRTGERLFREPIGHPCRPTGLCYCDASVPRMLWTYARGALLDAVLHLPFNGLKVWLLRRLGARIGDNVFLSVGVTIDPLYPQLLEIEDEVFIGMNAGIFTHEFRVNEFRVGRVAIRRGAFIGAYALIGCGVEIGAGASVAAGAAVLRDVPPGATAIGNPMRIVKRPDGDAGDGDAHE